MKTTLFAAVTALGLAASAVAYAGEGNGNTFGYTNTAPLVASAPRTDVGSNAYPDFSGRVGSIVTAVGALPTNGSEGIVQTANSLPRGFEEGTEAYMTAQSVNRYFAEQAAQARTLAQSRGTQPRG
jgi:hypothetical protein